MTFNAFIWGSCVSRDIPRITGQFDVSYYVGRQSLVSGFNKSSGIRPPFPNDFKSRFKKRSLSSDLLSSGPSLLREHARETDLVLLDLATERRGVFPVDNNAFVSNTVELKQSGLRELLGLDDSLLIPFGSELHLSLFTEATQQLSLELRQLGLLHRTLAINAPFAGRTQEGRRLSPNLGRTADEWNAIFPHYFNILSEYGIAITPLPPKDLVLSTKDHLWKQGQDHYIDETYEFWAKQIVDFSAINGYGSDDAVVDRGRDYVQISLPKQVRNVRLRGRLLNEINGKRFTLNAELIDEGGELVPIPRWPIYKTTNKSAKFIPQGREGQLFKLPSIHISGEHQIHNLTLSLFDKSKRHVPPIDLLVVGEDDHGNPVYRRTWNTARSAVDPS